MEAVVLLMTGALFLGALVISQRRWKGYRDRKLFADEFGFRPWEDPYFSGNPEVINARLTELADEIVGLEERKARFVSGDWQYAVEHYEEVGLSMAIADKEDRFLRLHRVAEELGRYLCRGSSCGGFKDHASPELARRP